jgi:hypothetical protein
VSESVDESVELTTVSVSIQDIDELSFVEILFKREMR